MATPLGAVVMQILIITTNQTPGSVVLPASGPLTPGLISEIAEAWLVDTTSPSLLQQILKTNLGEKARLRRFVVDSLTGNGTTISFSTFSHPETISYRGTAINYVPRHRSPFAVTLRSAVLAAKTLKQLQTYDHSQLSENQSL